MERAKLRERTAEFMTEAIKQFNSAKFRKLHNKLDRLKDPAKREVVQKEIDDLHEIYIEAIVIIGCID